MKALLFISIICGFYFLTAFILVHTSRNFSFFKNPFSEAAYGKYGLLTTLTFISAFISELIISYFFFTEGFSIPSFLFFTSGFSILCLSFFKFNKNDKLVQKHTFFAFVHFLFFSLGLFFLGFKNISLYTNITAILTIFFLIFQVLFSFKNWNKNSVTWTVEKLNILLINFWLIYEPMRRLIEL